MTRRAARSLTILIALSAGLASGVAADTRMVMREGTTMTGDASEMPEALRKAYAEAEPKTVTYWLASDRTARLAEDGKIIGRLDRGESYFVSTADRSYRVIEIGGDPPSGANGGSSFDVTKTGETRQIGPWQAVRHTMKVEMGGEPTEIELWVGDVGVATEEFRAFIAAFAQAQGAEWMRGYLELGGFPVRQEIRMGPMLVWQEVISMEEEPAPPGTYEVPAGYTKRE